MRTEFPAYYAFIESRPWLPRYRVVLSDASGKTLSKKKFWRKSKAQQWGFDYNEEAVSE